MNKKELASLLSKLKSFNESKLELEQYQTECNIASSILWQAFMSTEIEDKKVADLGCGNGVFGIGALILGAKEVIFLDKDKEAIDLAKSNLEFISKELNIKFKAKFINEDILDFNNKCDLVLQNPPFGIQSEKHADRIFLIKAMESAPTIYSIHTLDSQKFVEKTAEENSFKALLIDRIDLPIKRTQSFHKKDIAYTKAGIFKIERFKR